MATYNLSSVDQCLIYDRIMRTRASPSGLHDGGRSPNLMARHNAMSDHPIQTFDKLIKRQRLLLKLIGVDSYEPRYRMHALTLLFIGLATLFVLVSLYDMVYFKGDMFNVVYVLITFFFATIGIGRIAVFVSSSGALQDLLAESYRTYRQVPAGDVRAQHILRWYTRLFRLAVDGYTWTFLGTSVAAGLLPAAVYLLTGERVLPYGVVLPFVEPDSNRGYELNYLYQVSCIVWTPPGLVASQCLTFAQVLNICIQYDMLAVKLADLEELVRAQEHHHVARKLRELIRDQQRVESFVAKIEETYNVLSGVEVLSLGLQIVITLFVLQFSLWMPGLVMIPLFSLQLFVFCALGSVIQQKGESFSAGVYAISWHELPRHEKQIFRILLLRSQTPKKLTCAQMTDINMNLFVMISQKFYSIFMMLRSI
uniref:Uncharacterized protein n=1 Tax=Anopheles atroparvus TaxID=41427 RepID=A0A182JA45_ANOAO